MDEVAEHGDSTMWKVFMLRLMLLKFSVSTWFAPGHAFPLSVSHFAIPAKWFFRHISVHGTFPKFLANFRWSLLNLLCFLKQSPVKFIFVWSKKKKEKRQQQKTLGRSVDVFQMLPSKHSVLSRWPCGFALQFIAFGKTDHTVTVQPHRVLLSATHKFWRHRFGEKEKESFT